MSANIWWWKGSRASELTLKTCPFHQESFSKEPKAISSWPGLHETMRLRTAESTMCFHLSFAPSWNLAVFVLKSEKCWQRWETWGCSQFLGPADQRGFSSPAASLLHIENRTLYFTRGLREQNIYYLTRNSIDLCTENMWTQQNRHLSLLLWNAVKDQKTLHHVASVIWKPNISTHSMLSWISRKLPLHPFQLIRMRHQIYSSSVGDDFLNFQWEKFLSFVFFWDQRSKT